MIFDLMLVVVLISFLLFLIYWAFDCARWIFIHKVGIEGLIANSIACLGICIMGGYLLRGIVNLLTN